MGRASLRITVQATLPVVPQGCFAFLAAVATINEGAKVQLFYLTSYQKTLNFSDGDELCLWRRCTPPKAEERMSKTDLDSEIRLC